MRKKFSIILAFVMVITIFSSLTVFSNKPDYSIYDPITGGIYLDKSTYEVGDTVLMTVYVDFDDKDYKKPIDLISLIHIIGGWSGNLTYLETKLLSDIKISRKYDSTENNSIDYSIVQGKTDEFITSNGGKTDVVVFKFEAAAKGTAKIWIDESYVRTDPTTPLNEDNQPDPNIKDHKRKLMSSQVSLTIFDGDSGGSGSSSGGGGGSNRPKDVVTYNAFFDLNKTEFVSDDEAKNAVVVTKSVNDATPETYKGTDILIKQNTDKKIIEVYVANSLIKTLSYKIKADSDETDVPDQTNEPKEIKFAEIDSSHWGYPYVSNLVELGIVAGDGFDSEGNIVIRPNGLITREEATKIAVSSYGISLPDNYNLEFADADDISGWAKPYVYAAFTHENKIVRGYEEDNTFRPENAISREELATLIINTFGFGINGNQDVSYFADADKITWSKAYIAKAVELEIVLGYDDKTFRPQEYITRVEAMTMFSRALSLYNSLKQ